MKIPLCLLLLLIPICCIAVPQRKTEGVKLTYDLMLSKCKDKSCHSESAGHADVYINLTAEDPTYSWGYETMQEHAGSLEYQLRFNVSRKHEENQFERNLVIGFSGRVETLLGKQLTWAEKKFSGKNWETFKMASVEGTSYSQDDETITPTLRVLQVKIFP
jgi:hypothetical protein